MYGPGQGFNDGVRTAGGFLFKALEAKRDDKRFYDQLALDHAWNEVIHGRPSLFDRSTGVMQMRPGASRPIPYQVTRSTPSGPAAFLGKFFGKTGGPSPAESLAGKFQNPNPTMYPERLAGKFTDPTKASPMPQAQPRPSGPRVNIEPNTPLPPLWMMRRGFRRGY